MFAEIGVAIASGDPDGEQIAHRPINPRHEAAALRVEARDAAATSEVGELTGGELAADLHHRIGESGEHAV